MWQSPCSGNFVQQNIVCSQFGGTRCAGIGVVVQQVEVRSLTDWCRFDPVVLNPFTLSLLPLYHLRCRRDGGGATCARLCGARNLRNCLDKPHGAAQARRSGGMPRVRLVYKISVRFGVRKGKRASERERGKASRKERRKEDRQTTNNYSNRKQALINKANTRKTEQLIKLNSNTTVKTQTKQKGSSTNQNSRCYGATQTGKHALVTQTKGTKTLALARHG